MPRKKILWLCSWYPNKLEPFNGDFIQRHAQAAAFYNDIHIIHVAGDTAGSFAGTSTLHTPSEGLTEHIIYYKKPTGIFSKFSNYWHWTSAYKKAIRKYSNENGKPDIIHVHVPMIAGLIGIKIGKKFSAPYLVTEHWTIYHPESQVKYEEQSALFKSVLRRIIKNCRLLLPVSRNLGLLMNKKVIPKEFSVIENVANEKYFFYRNDGSSGSSFRFIHVSNMTYQKNAEGIIECFAEVNRRLPGTELVIVGSVPPAMRQLIEGTGLLDKKIFLKGEVSYPEVAGEMQQANALVMFSRFENSPCSIIEALCCGLPVIATDAGGIPELVNEKNGLLIESGHKEALGAAMEKMVSDYGEYDRKRIAEQAGTRFSYVVIGKKLDNVYTNVKDRG